MWHHRAPPSSLAAPAPSAHVATPTACVHSSTGGGARYPRPPTLRLIYDCLSSRIPGSAQHHNILCQSRISSFSASFLSSRLCFDWAVGWGGLRTGGTLPRPGRGPRAGAGGAGTPAGRPAPRARTCHRAMLRLDNVTERPLLRQRCDLLGSAARSHAY